MVSATSFSLWLIALILTLFILDSTKTQSNEIAVLLFIVVNKIKTHCCSELSLFSNMIIIQNP